jgi:hypothetical protein
LGRWPANLVLQHLDGCVQDGTRKVKVVGATAHAKHHNSKSPTIFPTIPHEHSGFRDADGTETVAAWDCAEGCPVAALDAQSGVTKSTGGRIGNAQGVYTNQGRTGWSTTHEAGDPGFGDTGGASRFFKQVK